ncbi:tryptophan--tRNA ligase [Candidatus Peregrinibacteria bacterium CG10_big_fil_rev_8_21_14_0_10_49_16]|nr:MAG: tryptophan--tRNA ligase [Candidatus Peregrinibacteria bacterium CG22_combo_CG10-13_8_21_14_all_49_11]PIR51972.1 MAG: tryptophan--tRNA ligase [Candidatus Peregrinibacteria bacterium CG10_big_fil_rev_8_21_14_0_10_49_16]
MRVLSGIQPSGAAHVGNYFGSIKPNIDLLGEDENIYIVVDLHALTTVHDPEQLRSFRQDLTKDLLACGFDPDKGILFFQSYVSAHAELAWVLNCVTPVGFLERAVSYKDKVQKGIEASAGLFTYPVLQAADILLYDADIVPVGKDQKQHVEMARDIAQKFNHRYGEGILTLPEVQIQGDVAVIPGTDGQKMSKSYNNTIPLFSDEKVVTKAIMGIVTDSKGATDPKDPDSCIIYQIHKLLLDEKEAVRLADEYREGLSYGDAKKRLLGTFMDYFGPMRKNREDLKDSDIAAIMADGAARAKTIAEKTMERVQKAVGLR